MKLNANQTRRPAIRWFFFAVAALILSACGTSARDSIVLPETAPPELVAEFENGDSSGDETDPVGDSPTETVPQPTSTEAPGAIDVPDASEASEASEAVDEASPAISPDVTIPVAVSESGRNPAYGGGNGGIPLVDALSVSLPTVGGEPVDVSQYLGQDVVLWFWAPWCSWCNVEAERVKALATEFDSRVEFVGVSGLSDEPSMQEFVYRHDLGHITHLNDVDGQFWVDLDVTYQPWWMFINDNGEVVLNWQGRLSEDEIREVMNVLLVA